jgi:hypothetical protein
VNINPTTVNAAEDALDELFYVTAEARGTRTAGTFPTYEEWVDVSAQVQAIRALIAECRAAGAVLDKTEIEQAAERSNVARGGRSVGKSAAVEQAQNERLENAG